jgi:tRNA (mo5U34)-methyltransferase
VDPNDLRRQVEQLEWFHSIDLGHGITTPGTDDSSDKLSRLDLPEDLSGRRVLDIGAYDGFFSFAAERLGANRVVAIDTLAWERGAKSGRACFDLAHRALASKVETRKVDVMHLDRAALGGFDLVLCLGVLYHLRDPLGALERVAAVCDEMLVLETHTDSNRTKSPAMTFYESDELAGDASNWWGPNEALLKAFLRDVGFKQIRIAHRRSWPRRMLRSLYRAGGHPGRAWRLANQGRVVIQATR